MQVVSNFFKENTHKSFVFAASTPFEIQKGNLRGWGSEFYLVSAQNFKSVHA